MGSLRSHYEVLGIDRSADDQAVRRAWKVLVQVWHPDRFASNELRDEAERQTALINGAFQALKDPAKRSAYDRQLDAERTATRAAGTARARRPFEQSPFATAAPSRPRHGGFSTSAPEPAPAQRTSEAAADFVREIFQTARRHPRAMTGLAAAWVVLVGSGLLMSYGTQPELANATGVGASRGVSAPDPTLAAAARRAEEQLAEATAPGVSAPDVPIDTPVVPDAPPAAPSERTSPKAGSGAKARTVMPQEQPQVDALPESPADEPYAEPPAAAPQAIPTTRDGKRVVRVLPQ